MVFEHAHEHRSQWAAIRSVAEKLDCTTEALRRWVRQAERDEGAGVLVSPRANASA
jgi:transposase